MGGMNAAQIIEALGDTAEVAGLLHVNLNVVSNMKLRGIPRSRMLDIHEIAQRKKLLDITPEVIRAATVPPEKADAA